MFAAYSVKDDSKPSESKKTEETISWLKNESFQQSIIPKTSVAASVGIQSQNSGLLNAEQRQSDNHLELKTPTSTCTTTQESPTTAGAEVITTSKEYKKSSERRKKKKKDEKHQSKVEKKLKKKKKSNISNIPPEPELSSIGRKSIFSGGLQLKLEESFYKDVKGCKDNFAFPNMYFKNVARHHQMRGILGAHNSSLKLYLKKPKPLRYFGKKSLRRLAKITNLVQPVQQQPSETNPFGIYDSSTVLYIQGNHIANPDEPPVKTKEFEISRQTALFNEKLRENPHDIDLWLSFIEHQNIASLSMTEENADDGKNQHKSHGRSLHPRALLERKVAILDKAIEQNPKSTKLLSARLNIAAEYWDSSALHQEWRNVLFVNPMSIELWKEYLNFIENSFEGFSVSQVLKTYASCFQKLVQMQQPSFASHQRPTNLEDFMIDIGMRLCSFLRQCGWTEKSVSLSQALLELCFKRPDDLSLSFVWLKALWESHVPRTGEVNCNSGAQMTERQPIRAVHGIDALEDEDAIINSGQSFPVVWHKMEYLRSHEHFQACSNSSDCDDEDRFVSFADLSQYLFVCEKKDRLQFRLVVGCLVSLGVPLLPASQAQLFWAPLVHEDNLLQLLANVPKVASLSSSLPDIFNSISYLTFVRRVVLQCYSMLTPPHQLELALWWLDVERVRIRAIVRSSKQSDINRSWKETKCWIKAFLKNIPSTDSASTVLLYNGYAAVEREVGNEEEYQKILGQLLQMYSANPLVMDQQQSKTGFRAALIRTWFSYSRSFLQSKNRQQPNHSSALAQLVALGAAGASFSPHGTPPTPAILLKAKRKYQAMLQDFSSSAIECDVSSFDVETPFFNSPDEFIELLRCYSYFLSLSEGCLPAFQMVQQWLETSQKSDFHFTTENRYNIEFLRYHIRRESAYVTLLDLLSACQEWVKDFQPRLFHDTLCTALAEYPDSMQLLAILIDSEERCSMFSGLWNSLTMRAKDAKNKSSYRAALAACLALANREEAIKKGEETTFKEWASDAGGIATLHLGYRRKLEHLTEYCVTQCSARHVALMWRILMHSAHLTGDSRKCKGLFYRAFRDCPVSKSICMDIVEYVPASIREVAKLMAEKDLRLRVPLEELDVLLETENEEIFDELQQDPDIKDIPFDDAKASPEENIESMTSESENDFSNDSSET